MTSGTFLEPPWFDDINSRLAAIAIDPDLAQRRVSVVFQFLDAPATAPHAMTFRVEPTGARVEPVDDISADLVVTITYEDAARLARGEIRSSQALRDGRLKVRGDVNALIVFSTWMSSAQSVA